MANLVFSSAIDSESTVTAPVKLEDHALIGAAAVAMPGTTLGKGATLGAMAASLPGAQLPGEAAAAVVSAVRSQYGNPRARGAYHDLYMSCGSLYARPAIILRHETSSRRHIVQAVRC